MESLFDTINVRDLLAAHDLSDPTSPLSAPDLHLLIQRLESHSLHIKSKVQSYIVSHHEDFANLFSLCTDAVSQSHQISDGVSDILRLISDSPADSRVREVLDEMKGKKEELKVKRELLGLVRTIVEVNERLKGVNEGLANGRFKFAAERLRELRIVLRITDDDNHGFDDKEPVVYGLLRKEWSQCFEEVLNSPLFFLFFLKLCFIFGSEMIEENEFLLTEISLTCDALNLCMGKLKV